MAPSKVVLIRHAQSESNLHGGQPHLPDPPLTPKGEAQSAYLASTLAGLPFEVDVLLVSPILRTLQTSLLGVDVVKRAKRTIVLPELQETGNVPSDTPRRAELNRETVRSITDTIDSWDWTRTVSENRQDGEDWLNNRGLFTFSDAKNAERAKVVREFLEALDGVVVVVSHGYFIRYLQGKGAEPEKESEPGYYYNNCEARSYSFEHGHLVNEEKIHVGGNNRADKAQGKVATPSL